MSQTGQASIFQTNNPQLRLTQARRLVGRGPAAAIEAAGTIAWALASLIATTLVAFA